jgi:hypothetical protein
MVWSDLTAVLGGGDALIIVPPFAGLERPALDLIQFVRRNQAELVHRTSAGFCNPRPHSSFAEHRRLVCPQRLAWLWFFVVSAQVALCSPGRLVIRGRFSVVTATFILFVR